MGKISEIRKEELNSVEEKAKFNKLLRAARELYPTAKELVDENGDRIIVIKKDGKTLVRKEHNLPEYRTKDGD